ncbi:MAG: methylenetetrahydrofolate--tRNA-(uracil(54)-C(5))-methyltransferase (FADH(2)-oxidizing) TrmFO [Mycoplasmatales bacterium]
MNINIIGAGLAGVETAWFLANNGVEVNLFEQKPHNKSDAHSLDSFAELVCSNSFRSDDPMNNAVGLLKEEMRMLGSLTMQAAQATQVPAGGALGVDREAFSSFITDKINNHKNINVILEEVVSLNEEDINIICTGPLTSDKLSEVIQNVLGKDYFYFFDAAAPIITKESINMDIAYLKSRYDKGEAAYINCPMTKEEFNKFYQKLISAECVDLKDFENNVFEGCMPIEVMAKRGDKTLTFGPLKPVGLEKDEEHKPYAVVQLRQDNAVASLYNLVGFQTHLKFKEQEDLLKLIPGLEDVEIVRYGVMHKNNYINSPTLLNNKLEYINNSNIMFAGQITGVEGYAESAACGIVAGYNVLCKLKNKEPNTFPRETAIGSLIYYINNASPTNFQPMNVTYGIIKPLETRVKKKEKKPLMSQRALDLLKVFIKENL